MPSPKAAVIVKALQPQNTVREIAQELGVPSKTICRIKDQLKIRGAVIDLLML